MKNTEKNQLAPKVSLLSGRDATRRLFALIFLRTYGRMWVRTPVVVFEGGVGEMFPHARGVLSEQK
jgi:hypothetical protein